MLHERLRRWPAFWVPADGSGEPEPLFTNGQRGAVSSFSPDGDMLAFQRRDPDTGLDLWVRPLKGPSLAAVPEYPLHGSGIPVLSRRALDCLRLG